MVFGFFKRLFDAVVEVAVAIMKLLTDILVDITQNFSKKPVGSSETDCRPRVAITNPADNAKIPITDGAYVTPQPGEGCRPVSSRRLIVMGTVIGGTSVNVNNIRAQVNGSNWRAELPITGTGEMRITANCEGETDQRTVRIFAIEIVNPTDNQQFHIDAVPAMPTIQASARIIGLSPDPTANTQFNWELVIGGNYRTRPPARWEPYERSFSGQSQGTNNWIVDWGGTFIGGWGRLRVTCNVDGATIQSDYRWIDIDGRNANRNDVIRFIRTNGRNDTDILVHIMCHESLAHQYYQFRANRETREPVDNRIPSSVNPGAAPGGQSRSNRPVFGAPPAGIGIAQRDPAPFPNEHWNWQSNVLGGIDFYYNEKVPIAGRIYNIEQSRLDRQRQEAMAIINWARSQQSPPLPAINLPTLNVNANHALSTEQLRRAKIRAYNGGFNYRLDFNYQIDANYLNGQLQGTGNWIEDPGIGYNRTPTNLTVHARNFPRSTFTWRQVDPARRGYVNDVEACH